jgi:hypothetical protein
MKLNIIVFAISLTIFSNCYGQRSTEEEERMNMSCIQPIFLRVNSYSWQLNFWSKELPLPDFIFDVEFDRNIPIPECIGDKRYFSYRKFIISSVVNEEALKAIVDCKDSRLDSIFLPERPAPDVKVDENYYSKYPYVTHSLRYMASVQLKKIQETKKNIAQS